MDINELILNLTDKNIFLKYTPEKGLQIFGASNLDSYTVDVLKKKKAKNNKSFN